MELVELQRSIRETYGERDAARGVDGTFRWFIEEVGELARTVRHDDPAARRHEVSDVLAWLCSVADLLGVDVDEAASRYANGCPKCGGKPCRCAIR